MKYFLLIAVVSVSLFSCQKENKIENVERSFYHWKSNSIDYQNIDKIKELDIHKIYFKLFEVDYNEVRGNFPYNKNQPSSYHFNGLEKVQIVPTIFIYCKR